MRFLPTRFHGVLDYIAGPLLISTPWLFGYEEAEVASWTAIVAGVLVLMQTAFTDMEVGLIKKRSMSAHLITDVFLGILLAVSPWPLGFAQEVYMPHLLFGLYLLLTAFTTHRIPRHVYSTTEADMENGWDI